MEPSQSQGKSLDDRLDSYFQDQSPREAEPAKQPEPTPSSNQEAAEVENVQAPSVETTPPQGTVNEEQEALENSKNPERTKAYIDKLKKELEEARSQKSEPQPETGVDYGTSVFDSFRPQVQQPQPEVPQAPPVNAKQYTGLNPLQVEAITKQFVDKEGNVDIDGLNRALSDANQRANAATQRVQSVEEKLARFEETQQLKEAYAVFPQLDPLNKGQFDPKLYELVRDRLLRNMYEGKPQSLLHVAQDITGVIRSTPPVNEAQVREQAVNEYKQIQQNRNQGPIEQGRGEPRQQAESYDDLRARTRRESARSISSTALDERLKRYFGG